VHALVGDAILLFCGLLTVPARLKAATAAATGDGEANKEAGSDRRRAEFDISSRSASRKAEQGENREIFQKGASTVPKCKKCPFSLPFCSPACNQGTE
jgi:hypothetical protein